MSKSYLYLFVLSISFIFIISSCKRDAPIQDLAVIEVDFLTNELDLERYGLEFTEQEFARDNDDPNKVLTVKVGEPVKFKDTSKGSSNIKSRRWQLNENEWELAKESNDADVPEFTHVFEDPGFHQITLIINDFSRATKLIKVVSGEYIPDDPAEDVIIAQEEEVQQPDLFEEEKKDTRPQPERETTKPTRTETTNNTNTRKTTPPASVKINTVNFVLPSEAMVGQNFELKDISSPASAITVRQWDMGNGTVQKSRGSTYNQMYFSSGQYTITLCLNNTDQCTSKRITIKPKPPRKETVQKTPVRKDPVVKKPAVASVDFNLPSTAMVAAPVNIVDRSQPSSAVAKRRWSFGDGTADLNTGKSSISHTFLKAGTYTVKLCVNDSDKCIDKKITINEKPKEVIAAPKAPSSNTASSLDDYEGTTPGRVGLISSMKCGDQNYDWHEGNIFINISPKKMMELEEAKVYSSGNGTVDIILTTGDKKQTGIINNVQLNPGASVIYLTDLAVILMPGEKYTLMIKPNSDVKFENSAKCDPKPLSSDVVSVSYNDKFVLYDLKFYY